MSPRPWLRLPAGGEHPACQRGPLPVPHLPVLGPPPNGRPLPVGVWPLEQADCAGAVSRPTRGRRRTARPRAGSIPAARGGPARAVVRLDRTTPSWMRSETHTRTGQPSGSNEHHTRSRAWNRAVPPASHRRDEVPQRVVRRPLIVTETKGRYPLRRDVREARASASRRTPRGVSVSVHGEYKLLELRVVSALIDCDNETRRRKTKSSKPAGALLLANEPMPYPRSPSNTPATSRNTRSIDVPA